MNIAYRNDATISIKAAIDLYRRAALNRPLDRPDIFEGMLKNANLIISAWDGDRLAGIARSLTDFSYVAYLSDLAVDIAYQRQGIGKQLIYQTQQGLGKECKIVLLAAPTANEYYPKVGFEHHPRAWILRR